MSDFKARPIIIKKKIVKHGGHHGGAWKVAYADFVTALMSLFIVLWLMNSNARVKEAVAGYFRDPAGAGKVSGTDNKGRDKTLVIPNAPKLNISQQDLDKLVAELQKALTALPNFADLKDHIVVTITEEGIRMELIETAKGLFFANGSPNPSKEGQEVLRTVSEMVGKMPNRVMIEGHTDAVPFPGDSGYSNWELSSARANAARVLMESSGLRSGQLYQIRGFADQQLRVPADPKDPSNRRISIIIMNLPKPRPDPKKAAAPADNKTASKK